VYYIIIFRQDVWSVDNFKAELWPWTVKWRSTEKNWGCIWANLQYWFKTACE